MKYENENPLHLRAQQRPQTNGGGLLWFVVDLLPEVFPVRKLVMTMLHLRGGWFSPANPWLVFSQIDTERGRVPTAV